MKRGALLLALVACSRPVQLVYAPTGERAKSLHDAGVVAPSSAAEPTGIFTGTGMQSDGHGWPVRIELTSAMGRCARISYPSVPCEGVWTCLDGESIDGHREAVESIRSGHCIDGGTFRYRVRGDALEFTWRKAGESLTARGTLTRSEAAEPADDDDGDFEEDE